nr:ribonuclease H-like domain-containing protein [Tanacetum cinerariifolium]
MSCFTISSDSIVESIGSSASPVRFLDLALVIDSESEPFEDSTSPVDSATSDLEVESLGSPGTSILPYRTQTPIRKSFPMRTPRETILLMLLVGIKSLLDAVGITCTDSDYAEANLDKKSTTGGCQFLGCRLISWQCKKQIVVANSTTEAEYVAASIKTASTPMETQKPLLKNEDGEEVDVHIYRSMIRSLMYLTSLRPDIMFAELVSENSKVSTRTSELKASSLNVIVIIENMIVMIGKAKKSVRLMTEKLFEMELELILLFWSTVMAKTINGKAQLHARVDGKKIIITEASIRRDLQLADEEGVDCLPNSTIFEQLALMGPKTTAWNKFSSTVAFAIICLATNKKFNILKWIFDSVIRNLDNVSGKFLMYPRFVQVFLDKHVDGLSNHGRKYISPSHTKKIFRIMKKVGKGFSGRVTPLFPTMMVQSELGEGSAMPTNPHHTPTILQSSSSQPQKPHKPKKPIRKVTQVPQPSGLTECVADEAVHKELGDSLVRTVIIASSLEAEQDSGNINKTQSKATPNEPSSQGTNLCGGLRCQETIRDTTAQTRFESVSKHSNDSLLARGNTLRSDEDSMKLNELMELCTNLQIRVLDLEKTKTTQS